LNLWPPPCKGGALTD